jgi:hypothetical protein
MMETSWLDDQGATPARRIPAATLDTIRKFIFSFVFRAATRLRFDLKEK